MRGGCLGSISVKGFKQYSGRNLGYKDAVSIEIISNFDIVNYLGLVAGREAVWA